MCASKGYPSKGCLKSKGSQPKRGDKWTAANKAIVSRNVKIYSYSEPFINCQTCPKSGRKFYSTTNEWKRISCPKITFSLNTCGV
jgi:hypothetical protein